MFIPVYFSCGARSKSLLVVLFAALVVELRRRDQHVVPGVRRLDADLLEEICAVVNGIWHEVLREAVPLLRLRVEAALAADDADLPDLALDLLDDLAVVDDVILEPGLGREVAEDVVAAAGS